MKTVESLKHLKAPEETTVVIAMSGGVDSSVAAALMVERGYNCIGIMMRLWAETGAGEGSTNKCCSVESMADARQVADQLGIPFYLINVEQPFKQNVVDFFIEGYSAGLTPNPCLACNRHIRFDYLLNYARNLGADYLVTGHHARTRRLESGQVQLLKAVDTQKDQSYVLSVMGQAELRDVLFPVGDFTKPQIRQMAAAGGLPIASKHDSMDLCFIADDDYRRFLQDWAASAMQPGPIVDRKGTLLGQHRGLPNYTIGQRKGLGLSGTGTPLFVLELDSDRNALVVGRKEELGQSRLLARNVNWTSDVPVGPGFAAQCKIRYSARPMECTLYPVEFGAPQSGLNCGCNEDIVFSAALPDQEKPCSHTEPSLEDAKDGDVVVQFAEPLYGVSPGQGAIFYADDVCLGGGLIAR